MTAPGLITAYINPKSSAQLQDLATHRNPDGSPMISVVCLFGANYAASTPPYLRAENNQPPTTQPFNTNIETVLTDGSVAHLQAQGIKVLLTVINGWAPVGWSEFTSATDAKTFASYLKTDVVDAFGLDGIDIDDEYSTGTPNDTSLPMVTTFMRQLMPSALITKALFADIGVFQGDWNGTTLADNLDHGWEMTYGRDPKGRLSPYAPYLPPHKLSLGFSPDDPSPHPDQDVAWLKAQGYAGAMGFSCETAAGLALVESLATDWTT